MKFRTLFICILISTFTFTNAFAEITTGLSSTKNEINVSGNIDEEEVTVFLINHGYTVDDAKAAAESNDSVKISNIIKYYRQISTEDGMFSIDIPMSEDANLVKYELLVGNEIKTINFANLSYRYALIKKAKDSLSNGTFLDFAKENVIYLCDFDMYKMLTNPAKVWEYAAEILKNATLVENDSESLSAISNAFNIGVLIQLLNENKSVETNTVINTLSTLDMPVPVANMSLIKPDKLKDVLSAVSDVGYVSVKDFAKGFSEVIYLNVLNKAENMSNDMKKEFFEKYADKLGVSLTTYNKLSSNEKLSVIAQLSAKEKSSIAALQNELDTLCKSEVTVNPDRGGVGSGGGGVGSGVASVTGTGSTLSPVESISKIKPFSDLDGYSWAENAIENLYSEGIINGYEDNTFRPQKNITRAEFVKVVTKAYLSDYEKSNIVFNDVSADDWYFSYVMSAYENGVVKGSGANMFYPNDNINRQDIAVVLYNLAKFLNIEGSVEFSNEIVDSDNISDYAEDAVYFLKNAGVITGDETGAFRPKDLAIRAEAIQMFYKFTLLMKGRVR